MAINLGTSIASTLSTIALTTALISVAGQAQAVNLTGTSAGEFGAPLTPDPSSVYSISSQSGGKNNRLTWGTPTAGSFSNYVQYDGTGFSADVDGVFDLGKLTYRNGMTTTDSNFDGDFPLKIALSLSNPISTTENFNFLFNILNTPNITGDPVLDGDKLRFSTTGISSQTFSYNNVDYTLQLIGLSSDGGKTILSQFNSPEDSVASADLFGKITAVCR
jgi:hypothetical protein